MVKYTLPFVNNGAPFSMPNWTPKKHEAALAEMLNDTEKYKKRNDEGKVTNQEEIDEIQSDEFKYYVILQSLRDIDDSVTMKSLRDNVVHPDNIIELFNAVYSAGKITIIFSEPDFQKTPVEKK